MQSFCQRYGVIQWRQVLITSFVASLTFEAHLSSDWSTQSRENPCIDWPSLCWLDSLQGYVSWAWAWYECFWDQILGNASLIYTSQSLVKHLLPDKWILGSQFVDSATLYAFNNSSAAISSFIYPQSMENVGRLTRLVTGGWVLSNSFTLLHWDLPGTHSLTSNIKKSENLLSNLQTVHSFHSSCPIILYIQLHWPVRPPTHHQQPEIHSWHWKWSTLSTWTYSFPTHSSYEAWFFLVLGSKVIERSRLYLHFG